MALPFISIRSLLVFCEAPSILIFQIFAKENDENSEVMKIIFLTRNENLFISTSSHHNLILSRFLGTPE